jgi:hypothetical protein
MRIFLLSMLLIALPAPGADRAGVMGLLEGYEWRPDKAAFDQLGQDAWHQLIEVAGNGAATNLVRGRAMAALTLYPNDEVWTWFVSAATHDGGQPVLRRRALDAMCATFATRRADALEGVVEPLLQAADAHLRVSAAKCLRTIGGNKADAALSQYRRNIHQPWEARAAGLSGAN